MDRLIIHVDMDAFYASIEARDNPALAGKPLIIGALPQERGVVATCSYEARKFGVHSAQNIKEAYKLCPHGIFMHPDRQKYHRVSAQLHRIWRAYADVVEYIALDEGYLDVTRTADKFGGARTIAWTIKKRTKAEVGLTCSVGVGYSMTSAKMASEEKKPDGFFEIPTPEAFVGLVIDRSIRVLHGVGEKTAEKLTQKRIFTVRDVQNNRQTVIQTLGKVGKYIADLSLGIDERPVTHSEEAEARSIGREVTFQRDTLSIIFLRDVLMILSISLEARLRRLSLYARTVTLKLTYSDMKSITRSHSGESIHHAYEIFMAVIPLLKGTLTHSIRLIGISLQNLGSEYSHQLTFGDLGGIRDKWLSFRWEKAVWQLQQKYAVDLFRGDTETEWEEHLYDVISQMRHSHG
ncbi:MAG: DNA polymerase IV [Fretibacterium sp.]|nr:DNA polymerase IV [Fretibacterium sp.]